MSFQKRTRQLTIPGTKPSLHNGQLLTSTGNPSLDHLFGGGQQMGTVFLVEEDTFQTYSNTLVKYFLAEGILQEHRVFFASLEDNAKENIIDKLPAPVEEKPHRPEEPVALVKDEDLKIAWRYTSLPKVDPTAGASSNFEHNFDLSKRLPAETIQAADLTFWEHHAGIQNEYLSSCLRDLHKEVQKHSLEKSQQLLRVVLQSVGSPYWYKEKFCEDFVKFLVTLKAFVRHSTAVALITVPAHLLQLISGEIVAKMRSLVDYSIQLESFIGSAKATNPIFKDYHGLLYIRRLRAVNSPVAYMPKERDLAFKLKRRRFLIEKLHLPPELEETQEREQDDAIMGLSCSSTGKNKLDF